jgi:hypothetical protein
MATPSNRLLPSISPNPKKWKNRFQQYQQAAGLSTESEERQVSTLLYCMGEGSGDVTDDDKKKCDSVLAKFDAHFKVRKNIIFERACFNQRK